MRFIILLDSYMEPTCRFHIIEQRLFRCTNIQGDIETESLLIDQSTCAHNKFSLIGAASLAL